MKRWTAGLCGLLFLAVASEGRTLLRFVPPDSPHSILLPVAGIFLNSDSLYLNQRLLTRGVEYHVDVAEEKIEWADTLLSSTDTLTVVYHALPDWAVDKVGQVILPVFPPSIAVPQPLDGSPRTRPSEYGQQVRISGAKTFRFSTRTSGESDFGQSLDLRISGELSPGLELTGALTDRGYDPTYGSATSRLSELDKLNLQLKSTRLLARLGDIDLDQGVGGPAKQVSGATIKLSYPVWQMQAGAARPKGRYESATLTGEDRFQGPYQLSGGQAASPVVPGSETIWLDGRQLERGADKDYTIDYPLGQITFTARYPIDRRSRIEVDYEPLATTYRQEMLLLGGAVSTKDSLLSVSTSFYREGDDQSQLLVGELSDADRALLEESGDSDAYLSGVRPDTTGDYRLAVDSLPDTVWVYVGDASGDYRVTFSYLGAGNGDYRFLGGDRYEFVGNGGGDYGPVRIVPRPEQTDYYASQIGVRTRAGNLTGDLRVASKDRNLYSSRDDADNDGLFYRLTYSKEWNWHDQPNRLNVTRRLREANFATRERLVDPDQARTYLLPYNWRAGTDELLHQADLTVVPADPIRISGAVSRLSYGEEFHSKLGRIGLQVRPTDRWSIRSEVGSLVAKYDSAGRDARGDYAGQSFATDLSFRRSYRAEASWEHDRRSNDYAGSAKGTRFDRYVVAVGSPTQSLRYERYDEDSLELEWRGSVKRDRLFATVSRQLGMISLTGEAGRQKLSDRAGRSANFLGRTSVAYSNSRKRMQLQSSFLLSNELRQERGINYLEVEPGRGNFSLVDGAYEPDPLGNYIQVEELLSERAEVARGEKSFLFSKEATDLAVRFSSNIREELLDRSDRNGWWLVPFYSDASLRYLLFSRRYDGELRMVHWGNFYAINLALSDELEKRSIGGNEKERNERRFGVTLKQAVGGLLLEQSGEWFRSERDAYYIGAGSANGVKGTVRARRPGKELEWSTGMAGRHAKSKADDQADLIALLFGLSLRAVTRGELRADVELYRQALTTRSELISYTLTDSHNGRRGGIWTVGLRYAIRDGLLANLNVSGRHSDDRPGRVSGRGEVVATF